MSKSSEIFTFALTVRDILKWWAYVWEQRWPHFNIVIFFGVGFFVVSQWRIKYLKCRKSGLRLCRHQHCWLTYHFRSHIVPFMTFRLASICDWKMKRKNVNFSFYLNELSWAESVMCLMFYDQTTLCNVTA